MKALEVNSLFVTYDGRYAISDISFTADYGDFIAVVGENGSGKSTLVKTLLGLVSPSGGTVTFNGIDKNEIGYLPQQTPAQKDFPASVDEVVLSGCLASMGLRPFYSGTERAAAEKNMARLGITELRRRSYRDLSGGQQQRVLLARALCAAKKLLVLDEPAAGLDPVIAADLGELLASLNRDESMTVIVVSHDIAFALENAGKILHIGREKFFFGSPSAYTESELGRRFIDYGRYNH